MDRVFQVLPAVLKRRGFHAHAQSALVQVRAQQWMLKHLPLLQGCVKVQHIHEGILHIACTHSVAVQECRGILPALLQFVQVECPMGGVKDVRVVRE